MLELEACWVERPEWRGYVLTADRGWLLARHVFAAWLAGVFYHSDAVQDPSFAPGQRLRLVPDPENVHDPNAIAVWNEAGTIHGGYVPYVIAARVHASPTERVGLALWEYLEGDQRAGVGLLVSREEVTLQLRPATDHALHAARQLASQAREIREPWPVATANPMEQMTRMLEELTHRRSDEGSP